MSEQDYYQTIDKAGFAEFKDRGSRFLAFAFPMATVEEFKQQLQQLKKEHPKAVHHCFAYRIGLDGNLFRVSDDGEPSGSAGRPILGQIDSKELINLGIIVVRYFGGTLLGVPGLINAYKSAASMALQLIPVVQKPVEVVYDLQFDYTRMNDVMVIVKQYNCTIIMQEIQLFCHLRIGIPKARLVDVLYKLNDLHTIEVKKVKLFP
ncbi:IMPACT family protein [Sediminibacterium goheungense]|uniref:Putative YigZ family protein n=1 Tax=Sediminibacterium goheungense TaxID=1086393 RepID=A0A4V3C4R6_9BACT|nr:YigZ family protein [Sediminibacterium goheungense]TDO27048.1 putative YigZ family protein [Sediminibacterium goheungense]